VACWKTVPGTDRPLSKKYERISMRMYRVNFEKNIV